MLPDIQNITIDYLTIIPSQKNQKKLHTCQCHFSSQQTNFNALINNPTFSDSLINTFARKFYCSHETIARYLATKQAKQRLVLQYQLKNWCRLTTSIFNLPYAHNLLDQLIAQNIDLEFTYNYGQYQKTPLMISLDYSYNMFTLLLNAGANINGCNSHGLTPLKLVTIYPINPEYTKLLTQPDLNINQQNKYGESALLRCLIRRKDSPQNLGQRITASFLTMIAKLLNAGADPELANHAGMTPLDAAQRLRNEEILLIIQHAIDQKHDLTR